MLGAVIRINLNVSRFFPDDFTLVGHSELKAFVADANEAVNFKLLRKYREKGEEDKPACTKEEPFNPEMSHQVYGDT